MNISNYSRFLLGAVMIAVTAPVVAVESQPTKGLWKHTLAGYKDYAVGATTGAIGTAWDATKSAATYVKDKGFDAAAAMYAHPYYTAAGVTAAAGTLAAYKLGYLDKPIKFVKNGAQKSYQFAKNKAQRSYAWMKNNKGKTALAAVTAGTLAGLYYYYGMPEMVTNAADSAYKAISKAAGKAYAYVPSMPSMKTVKETGKTALTKVGSFFYGVGQTAAAVGTVNAAQQYFANEQKPTVQAINVDNVVVPQPVVVAEPIKVAVETQQPVVTQQPTKEAIRALCMQDAQNLTTTHAQEARALAKTLGEETFRKVKYAYANIRAGQNPAKSVQAFRRQEAIKLLSQAFN